MSLENSPFYGGQHYKRQAASTQILLMGKGLIARDEHLKIAIFGCLQKFAVLESIPPHIAGGENLMGAKISA